MLPKHLCIFKNELRLAQYWRLMDDHLYLLLLMVFKMQISIVEIRFVEHSVSRNPEIDYVIKVQIWLDLTLVPIIRSNFLLIISDLIIHQLLFKLKIRVLRFNLKNHGRWIFS